MFINRVSSTDHERVVIFLTDHSHEDTGDLYVGPKFCARIDDVSGLRYHLARALTLLRMAVDESAIPPQTRSISYS
jgi:hypothetical protein